MEIGWIYLLICYLFFFSGATDAASCEPKKQRQNAKKSKDFRDSGKPIQKFSHAEEFLRQNLSLSKERNEVPDDMDPKIINGREAEEGEFPWMVALHLSGRFICSAFLVSPSVVMTAAHCVEFEDGVEPASSFFGIIGNNNRSGPDTRIEFSEVAAHPDYGSGGSEGDIAVLRITEPIDMTNPDKIQTICLPSAGREFEMEIAQAMGWGLTSNTASETPERLMTTELNVQPRALCKIFYAFFLISITDRHVCASSERSTGICLGDSGGPLVYEDIQAGKPLAIGVSSFVTILGCGRSFVPSVFTATAAYTDWITETVGTDGICFV